MIRRFEVAPSRPLRGVVRVPGDKSISHRALMLAGLARGETQIRGLLEGEDVLHTARAMGSLGAEIARTGPGSYRVEGVGDGGLEAPSAPIDLGNSGTGMRLLAGILAGQPFASTLLGDRSLSRRPMERIVVPLRLMGSGIEATEGHPPLSIPASGEGLLGIQYDSPLASAQVKSCVLLAGMFARGQTRLREPRESRDHTERMLRWFGYPIERRDGWWCVPGRHPLTAPERLQVPGDISSAAFWLVAASLIPGSEITLPDVGINPRRCGIISILRRMGAAIEVADQRSLGGEPIADLRVHAHPLRGVTVEAHEIPDAIDEFPILFVAAAFADGVTKITGAVELRAKESDRIAVMASGLKSLGADVQETPDGAVIRGGAERQAISVDCGGDHRCAMALAVAGAASRGCEVIDVANVATSYPEFADHGRVLGMDIEVGEE